MEGVPGGRSIGEIGLQAATELSPVARLLLNHVSYSSLHGLLIVVFWMLAKDYVV